MSQTPDFAVLLAADRLQWRKDDRDAAPKARVFDILFFHTWWTYRTARFPAQAVPYHWFNLFEGSAWLVFAAMVLVRHLRHRRSRLELAYALAFFMFGLSDFREAWVLESWLIWAKLVNLGILLWLRAIVIRRFYPQSKLF
ncbi:MAG: hypothetical protein HYX69_06020 [Planctomycetia bacterium]|nr:hypothetical protein [Planctomycetia bacterium]